MTQVYFSKHNPPRGTYVLTGYAGQCGDIWIDFTGTRKRLKLHLPRTFVPALKDHPVKTTPKVYLGKWLWQDAEGALWLLQPLPVGHVPWGYAFTMGSSELFCKRQAGLNTQQQAPEPRTGLREASGDNMPLPPRVLNN